MSKTILISGASSGFGALSARLLAVVDTEKGQRPFRVHVDPSDDGAEVVFAVGDRIRAEFLRRVGLEDLLHPAN